MRKTSFAFAAFLLMLVLACATTVLNASRTYSATSQNSEIYGQLNLFGGVLDVVRSKYVEKPDDAKLIESAITGMLSALDPHSAYMNPNDVSGHANADPRRVRRARPRGHDGERRRQGRVAHRRHARRQGRVAGQRPNHSDRRRTDRGAHAGAGGREDAGPRQHPDHTHDRCARASTIPST